MISEEKAAHDRQHREHEEDDEEDPGPRPGDAGDPDKAEQAGNQGDDEEHDSQPESISQHDQALLTDGIKPDFSPGRRSQMPGPKQQADAKEHPEVLTRVGLLVNKPPAFSGLPFDESSDHLHLDRSIQTAFFMPEQVEQRTDCCKAAEPRNQL
jgi:hypothetical protein